MNIVSSTTINCLKKSLLYINNNVWDQLLCKKGTILCVSFRHIFILRVLYCKAVCNQLRSCRKDGMAKIKNKIILVVNYAHFQNYTIWL
jgi:hypothetical protein